MGEAKRKKLAQANSPQVSTIQSIDMQSAAKAVQKVTTAVTDFQGADCLLYAHIGAGLLSGLGVPAKAVAGSAAWRVGDGDGDVISHAREINGAVFIQDGAQSAGMFHAWIETADHVIDFSTHTLRSKAKQLDAADGGTTTVAWCPDFLCIPKGAPAPSSMGSALKKPLQVQQAPYAGVFNYTRHADIEAVVLEEKPEFQDFMQPALNGVRLAYNAIRAGNEFHVLGISKDGEMQEAAQSKPLVRI